MKELFIPQRTNKGSKPVMEQDFTNLTPTIDLEPFSIDKIENILLRFLNEHLSLLQVHLPLLIDNLFQLI